MNATEREFLNFLFGLDADASATVAPAFQIVATLDLDDRTLGGVTADGRFFSTDLRPDLSFDTAFANAVQELQTAARTGITQQSLPDFQVKLNRFERIRMDRIFRTLTQTQINRQFRHRAA